MPISTVTAKGRTTVPQEVREALGVKPRQQLEWCVRPDGTALVRLRSSALALFGSLPARKRVTGRDVERKAVAKAAGKHAAKEGI